MEAQVRQRIDALIERLSADVAQQLRGLADELAGEAAAERADAVRQAVEAAEEAAARQVSDAAADARMAIAGAQDELRVAAEANAIERAARAGEREAMLAAFEQLLDSFRRIDASVTLREVLDVLGEALSVAGARSLLLVRRDDVLRGWSFNGFGEGVPEPWSVTVSPEEAGPLGPVITNGERAEVHPDSFGAQGLRELAFASAPHERAGLAVPVRIGGITVGVGYVDDGGAADRVVPGPWPEVVEILARHASRRLEALTARRAAAVGLIPRFAEPAPPVEAVVASGSGAIEGAQRYARLLVAEIRLYNESAIRAGRQHRDLRRRLRVDIDRARRLYEERVPATLPGRAEYFERELVRTLAEGDPDALGPD